MRGCRWWWSVTPPTPRSTGRIIRAAAAADSRVRLLGSVWDNDLLDTLYAHATSYLHGHSVGGTNPSLLQGHGRRSAGDRLRRRVQPGGRRSGGCVLHETRQTSAAHARQPSPTRKPQRARPAGQSDVATRYRWDDVADRYEDLARGVAQYAPFPVTTALAVLARITDVQRDRPVLDVVQVHEHAVVPRHLLATGDLPQPRESRLGDVPAVLRVRQELHLLREHRPRGPTRDIDPPTTLSSWGSSSRLHRRRNRPTRVILGIGPVAVGDQLVRSSDDLPAVGSRRRWSWFGTSCTRTRPRTGRSSRLTYRAGPRESSLMTTAMTTSTGARMTQSHHVPGSDPSPA